jgi:hypothetical protein
MSRRSFVRADRTTASHLRYAGSPGARGEATRASQTISASVYVALQGVSGEIADRWAKLNQRCTHRLFTEEADVRANDVYTMGTRKFRVLGLVDEGTRHEDCTACDVEELS